MIFFNCVLIVLVFLLGLEFIDRVTLTPSLVIQKQSIGIAIESDGFEGVDGILG